MKQIILSLSVVLALSACGGGGSDSPAANPAGTATISSSVPTVQAVAPTVVPTLLHGVEKEGEALSRLLVEQNAFFNLSERNCVGATAFALDPATGLVEVVCAVDGRRLQYDTKTQVLKEAATLPKAVYLPTVACTGGVCLFGRGQQSEAWQLPSNAEMVVTKGENILARIPFPDKQENRAPAVLQVEQEGIVVAINRGFDQSEIGINRFDVKAQAFTSSCSLRLEMVDAVVARDTVFISVRQFVGTGHDVVAINSTTCAVRSTFRLPIADEGITLAKFISVVGDTLYIGGGSERLVPAVIGVWKFSLSQGLVTGFLPTQSQPASGVASQKNGRLYVSLKEGKVLEVDTGTMSILREFQKSPHGGNIFLAE